MNRAQTYRNIGLLFGCEALTRTGAIIVLTTMGLAGRALAGGSAAVLGSNLASHLKTAFPISLSPGPSSAWRRSRS